MMAESDPDFKDIFVTQNTFDENKSVNTQAANKAAEFLLNDNDVPVTARPEVVQFWDFSAEENNAMVKEDNSLPVLQPSNLFEDDDDEVCMASVHCSTFYAFFSIYSFLACFS